MDKSESEIFNLRLDILLNLRFVLDVHCLFKMDKTLKFNVLQANQAFMARFGIYSYKLTESTNEFFGSITTYYILFFSIFSIVSCSKSMINDFSNLITTLEAIVIIVALTQGFGAFITLGYKMQEIKVLHLSLQSIVDKSMSTFFSLDIFLV